MMFLSNEEANRRLLFCNNLRDKLRHGPINPAELSRRTDISVSLIYSYMRGRTFPNEDRIRQLADGLECTVDDLFDGSCPPWIHGSSVEREPDYKD